MALVYIRPDADVVDGSWVNESASNTNLYDSLNETSPIDADFIRSSNLPANDVVTLRLSNFGGAVTEPMTVYYRYKAVSTSGDPLSLKVRLVQGAGGSPATTIAEWEHSDAAATYQDASQLLSTAQFNAISDFDDLFLEFEAITGALGAQLYAYGLLAGENDGFAIDATVYDVGEEAYVGGPIGGTLAVKGHTTNYTNVALDASVLSQSGTSPKMVQFPTAPYVRWTPHNLILQSQDFTLGTYAPTNATVTGNSTVAPDGTTTGDTVAATAGGQCSLNQSFTAVVGQTYTVSGYFKAGTEDWIFLYLYDAAGAYAASFFDLANGVLGTTSNSTMTVGDRGIQSVGNGWYRCYVTGVGVSHPTAYWVADVAEADNDSIPGAGDSVYYWGAQVNRGYGATPYLATTSSARIGIPLGYDIAQGQFGVLIEPAATNILGYSEDFTNGVWAPQNGTVSSNATTAPDGSSTADEWQEATTTASFQIYQDQSGVATTGTWTQSIFAKASDRSYLIINMYDGSDHRTWFDLSGGTVGTNAAGNTATIVSVGDGWYRCIVSRSLAGGLLAAFGVSNADNISSYAGTAGNGIYIWGAQVESGSVATSYIPTLGGTSTRATDNLDAATSTMPFSATKGTVYADYKPTISGTAAIPASFDNGTADERIYVRTHTDTNAYVTVVDGGGAPQADIDLGNTTGNTRTQITACWQANDFDGSVDGGAVQSDPGGTLPTVTNLQFGQTAAAAIDQPLWLYRLSYVPRQVETEGP